MDLREQSLIDIWHTSPKIISGTGHRPNKLGNEYDLKGKYSSHLRKELLECYRILKPHKTISGMALGFDQLLAITSIELGIKVLAAIPCDNQESRWPTKSQDLYHSILNNPLVTSKIVSPGPYHVSKMQTRNQWMCNNSDGLVAAWDGTDGGTANCVRYAMKIGKPLWRLDLSQVK